MWKHIRNNLRNRRGLGSIEIVISSLIIIMMIAGLVDMIQITQRLDTTSQTTGYIARIVQKQGGVQPNVIDNFNGKYTTTAVLYQNVKGMMESNGIPEEDWELILTTSKGKFLIQPNTNVPLVDYGHRIRVIMNVNLKWNVLSLMLPGELNTSIESSREVLSGYQIRDGNGMETDLNLSSGIE